MRKSVKRMLGAGVIAGVAYGAWRAYQSRVPARDPNVDWEAAPFPFPPVPRPKPAAVDETPAAVDDVSAAADDEPAATDDKSTATSGWLDPVDGACPASHPVKAKLSSGIFHVPGGANYERTVPDRCYASAQSAEADGLRQSKV